MDCIYRAKKINKMERYCDLLMADTITAYAKYAEVDLPGTGFSHLPEKMEEG